MRNLFSTSVKAGTFRVLTLAVLLTLSSVNIFAQSGAAINATGSAADPSAMLDVSAADKGVLIPRVALVSTTNPISVAKPDGLLVWNTSTTGTYATPGYYYWNGTDWTRLTQGDNLGNHKATQDLNMTGHKIDSLANPTAAMNAVNVQTIQNGALVYAAASGTDNYTVTLAPAVTGYTTGMALNFKVANANTGAVTLNVNGLGQKSVIKNSNLALVANDIKAGQVVTVIYDGTNFQMQSLLGNPTSGGGGGSSDPTLIYTTDGF